MTFQGMSFLLRFGTVGGILGGLAIGIPGTIESFTGKAVPTSFVLALSPLMALPLLTALYLTLPAGGRLASAGYATAVLGTGLFGGAVYTLDIVLVHLDRAAVQDTLRGTSRLALLGSVLVFVTGSVLFGVSLLRSGRYPRIPVWGYTVALPGLAIGASLPYSPYKGILHVLAGTALVWLALSLPSSPEGVPSGGAGDRLQELALLAGEHEGVPAREGAQHGAGQPGV